MMMTRFLSVLASLMMTFSAVAEPQSQKLTRQSQTDLSLTIYNGFAVVRDVRQVVLPTGELMVEYHDVASTLKPSSVLVKTMDSDKGVRILEQSYHYDLLNRQSLLDTYIGRKLKYSRVVLQGNSYEKVLREGILLSTNPEIVNFGDEIEISPEGVISLPDVPEGLILNPTLVWLMENRLAGQQSIATTYIANNLSWKADYVLVLNDKRKRLNLSSWATIRNDTGTVFRQAKVKLVAGNVNQVSEQRPKELSYARSGRESMALMSDSMPTAESLSAYQSFELPRRTQLLNHEEKQIEFIEVAGVKYEEVYRLQSQVMSRSYPQTEDKVISYGIWVDNTEANKLGIPLPAGVVRAYLQGEGQNKGSTDLIGETQFKAVPRDQMVVLALGQAFDLTAERTQTDFTRLSDRNYEASYEIEISNSKDEVLTVLVDELLQGDWQLLKESDESEKLNSQTLRFEVKVPARGKASIKYRVRWRL
ncbi:MAG: hypothetical protein ACI9W1_003147 [Candidatus Azotimanducaceae bacterium]|jgi:hypothetical protein